MSLEITRPGIQKFSVAVPEPVNQWDQAVFDLIIMTNTRRTTWKSSLSPAPHYDVVYNAEVGTKSGLVFFALSVVRSPTDIRDQILMSQTLPSGINRNPMLVMTKANKEEVVFPDLDSIRSLAISVERESQPQDADEILAELHEIAMGDGGVAIDKMSVTKYDENGNRYE